jgi:hypothetical protein
MKNSLSILALGAALLATPLIAQSDAPRLTFPAASPPAVIKQQVGVTDIEINYSRPSAKGRKIFGGLVPYGEVWRTGANQATRLSFSTPVKLNGTEIPAGNYELFTIPGPDEWTVIVHEARSQWGSYAYDAANDVARVKAKPVALPNSIETFTIQLSTIADQSAILYLAWEKTRVPLELEVDVVDHLVPQIKAVMASDAVQKPYAQAAMFYLNYNLDLDQAVTWMDEAIKANPAMFYLVHQKARMLAKQGKKGEALAAAQQSLTAAQQAGGAIGAEYTRLNEALIASLR